MPHADLFFPSLFLSLLLPEIIYHEPCHPPLNNEHTVPTAATFWPCMVTAAVLIIKGKLELNALPSSPKLIGSLFMDVLNDSLFFTVALCLICLMTVYACCHALFYAKVYVWSLKNAVFSVLHYVMSFFYIVEVGWMDVTNTFAMYYWDGSGGVVKVYWR